jgi:hypothetical protein
MQVVSVPLYALAENPDPEGEPRWAASWAGKSEAMLDGEPVVTACERLVRLIERLIEECRV